MSHHSNEYDKEMNKRMKEFFGADFERLVGPTGNFPNGKLTKYDEGEIAFAVGEKNGKVVINFNSPVYWLGMTPSQAIDLGNLLIKRGEKIRNDWKPL